MTFINFFFSFYGIITIILLLSILGYYYSIKIVRKQSLKQDLLPHSLLSYYGFYSFIWIFFPSAILLILWSLFSKQFIDNQFFSILVNTYPKLPESFIYLKLAQIQNISSGLLDSNDEIMIGLADRYLATKSLSLKLRFLFILIFVLIGMIYSYFRLSPLLKARIHIENTLRKTFFLAALVAILTTIGIISALLFQAVIFFSEYPMQDFFFGTHWSPMVALREGASDKFADEDVAGSTGSFGMIPVILGTLLVAFLAMCVAIPIGLFSAIYMAEFASDKIRIIIKPTLEVLAGIPTVVYGFFAALTAAPFFKSLGLFVGLDISSQSALAAGVVMGIMIIPFISSLSDDVIRSVPQSLRDGAYGLGSTKGETITQVVLPAAFPGLVGAFLLAVSRAIGETMIVVMAVGVAAKLTINPLDSVTTVTVQIVMLLTGDNEFDSVKTMSAFALGITLFVITLVLNVGALSISRKVGERYE